MNNEEKIFNLLEKVYIELKDTKKKLSKRVWLIPDSFAF